MGDGDEIACAGENVVAEDTPVVVAGGHGGAGGNVDVDGKGIGGDAVVIAGVKVGVESGGGDDLVVDEDAPTSCATPPGV